MLQTIGAVLADWITMEEIVRSLRKWARDLVTLASKKHKCQLFSENISYLILIF
jgi:hypothetical protein